MTDDRDDMEAAGFAEPDDHPIAGLSVDAGVTRWTCTRIQMIDALANIEAHPVLISGRAGIIADDMADAILGQLPEAEPGSKDPRLAELENALAWHTSCLSCSRILDSCAKETERAVRAEDEISRLRQDIADRDATISMLKDQVTS